jgi:hypothetical protein
MSESNVQLHSHQLRYEPFLKATKGHIAVDETGSGKTLAFIHTACLFLQEDPSHRILICSPKSLLDNIRNEMTKYGVPLDLLSRMFIRSNHQIIHLVRNAIELDPLSNVTEDERIATNLVNVRNALDGSNLQFASFKWMLILDECHVFSNGYSQRGTCMRYISALCEQRLLLTATVLWNSVTDLGNLLAIVHGNTRNLTPNAIACWFDPSNTAYVDIVRGLCCNYISFHTVDRTEYPTTEYFVVSIQMTPEQLVQYEHMERQVEERATSRKRRGAAGKGAQPPFTPALEAADTEEEESEAIDLSTAFYSSMRKFMNEMTSSENVLDSIKAEWINEFLQQQTQQRGNVPPQTTIYSCFLSSGLHLVEDVLRKKETGGVIRSITGEETTTAKRQATADAYNKAHVNTLLMSSAGSVGFHLENTRFNIKTEPGWTESASIQQDGRCARFRSHIGLPPEERHVSNFLLIVDKPATHTKEEGEHSRESIDRYLYNLSQSKHIKNLAVLNWLRAEICPARYTPNVHSSCTYKDALELQELYTQSTGVERTERPEYLTTLYTQTKAIRQDVKELHAAYQLNPASWWKMLTPASEEYKWILTKLNLPETCTKTQLAKQFTLVRLKKTLMDSTVFHQRIEFKRALLEHKVSFFKETMEWIRMQRKVRTALTKQDWFLMETLSRNKLNKGIALKVIQLQTREVQFLYFDWQEIAWKLRSTPHDDDTGLVQIVYDYCKRLVGYGSDVCDMKEKLEQLTHAVDQPIKILDLQSQATYMGTIEQCCTFRLFVNLKGRCTEFTLKNNQWSTANGLIVSWQSLDPNNETKDAFLYSVH